MSKNYSRRDFNKLVVVGTALGVFGAAKAAVPAAEKSASSSVALRWLPTEEAVLRRWHDVTRQAIRDKVGEALHPVIRKFQKLIDSDPVVRMYMTQMIQQVPEKYSERHPKDIQEYLQQLNAVLTVAPHYIASGHGEESALVGTPFSAILIWTMGTPAGFAAYRNPRINEMFKELLKVWTSFLNSKESRYVLNDSATGWMCKEAKKRLHMEDYIYKPGEPYWGFPPGTIFLHAKSKKARAPLRARKIQKSW